MSKRARPGSNRAEETAAAWENTEETRSFLGTLNRAGFVKKSTSSITREGKDNIPEGREGREEGIGRNQPALRSGRKISNLLLAEKSPAGPAAEWK